MKNICIQKVRGKFPCNVRYPVNKSTGYFYISAIKLLLAWFSVYIMLITYTFNQAYHKLKDKEDLYSYSISYIVRKYFRNIVVQYHR